jgi:hypothetical protein
LSTADNRELLTIKVALDKNVHANEEHSKTILSILENCHKDFNQNRKENLN